MKRAGFARVAAGSIPPAVACLWLLVAAPAATAQPAPAEPAVSVDVAPGEHTVGDRVAVDVSVTTAAGAPAPRFPAWGESWGEAEVVEVGDVETGEAPGGGVLYRQRLTLAAFQTGRVALPPQIVVLPAAAGPSRRLETPRVALFVTSVLPPAAEGEPPPQPKPARPLRLPPIGKRFWWTFALLAGAALLALGLVLRRFRRRPDAAELADAPPLERFAAGLAAARSAADPADALRLVSLSLRRYLGARLGFHAAESTSAEIRRRLAGRRLPDGVARPTIDLLLACDLVKFARRPADAGDVERWTATAEGVAQRVEEHLRPVAQPEAATARREAA